MSQVSVEVSVEVSSEVIVDVDDEVNAADRIHLILDF